MILVKIILLLGIPSFIFALFIKNQNKFKNILVDFLMLYPPPVSGINIMSKKQIKTLFGPKSSVNYMKVFNTSQFNHTITNSDIDKFYNKLKHLNIRFVLFNQTYKTIRSRLLNLLNKPKPFSPLQIIQLHEVITYHKMGFGSQILYWYRPKKWELNRWFKNKVNPWLINNLGVILSIFLLFLITIVPLFL